MLRHALRERKPGERLGVFGDLNHDQSPHREHREDRGRALSALETDYEHRSPNLTYMKLDPALDRLRNEPRDHALLKDQARVKPV